MDQSTQQLTPFPFGWYAFELLGYRSGNSMYTIYPYDDLPPIPQDRFIRKFQWLIPLDNEINNQMQPYRLPTELRTEWMPNIIKNRREIVDSAQQLGHSLSDAFLQFMNSTELQDRIPSFTDCWFLFSPIAPCPYSKDGSIIRFLQDNQGYVAWYLYLSSGEEGCVLASSARLEDPEQLKNFSYKEIIEQTHVCAPSFETFLYRFWIENSLAFNLTRRKPLSKEQKQYLSYYVH